MSRFPEAQKYVWKSNIGEEKGTIRGMPTSTPALIPCGLPIDGHEFLIKSRTSTNHYSVENNVVGNLHVSGPGLALGYLNNRTEMMANFVCHTPTDTINEIQDSTDRSFLFFNTMDLAYQNEDGLIFVVGRGPTDSQDSPSSDGNICSLTMGKLNGVLVHTAEINDAVESSLKVVLIKNLLVGTISTLNMVTVLLNDNSIDGVNKTTSATFVDLSSFQADVLYFGYSNTTRNSILDTSKVVFTNSDIRFHRIITETRSLILSRFHSTMVPHHIFLVSLLPIYGAAGKVDRSSLVRMAMKRIEIDSKSTLDDIQKIKTTKDFVIDDIVKIYSATLGLQKHDVEGGFIGASFSELGGDSMMAIDATHQILVFIREKGIHLSDDQIISPIDLMEFSIKLLFEIPESGGTNLPPEKKESQD